MFETFQTDDRIEFENRQFNTDTLGDAADRGDLVRATLTKDNAAEEVTIEGVVVMKYNGGGVAIAEDEDAADGSLADTDVVILKRDSVRRGAANSVAATDWRPLYFTVDESETESDSTPELVTDGGVDVEEATDDDVDGFPERDIDRPKYSHCVGCGTSFTFDKADVPSGIDPSYCRICGGEKNSLGGVPVVENWLTKSDDELSTESDRLRQAAQRAYVQGDDPLTPYRETDGENGLKRREREADDESLMLIRYRNRLRRYLIGGVPPFADPRNVPDLVKR